MTDLIHRLERCLEALIHALEEQNVEKIVEAARAIRPMVSEFESLIEHQSDIEIRTKFASLAELIDAVRYRVKFLTKISSGSQ